MGKITQIKTMNDLFFRFFFFKITEKKYNYSLLFSQVFGLQYDDEEDSTVLFLEAVMSCVQEHILLSEVISKLIL